MIEDIKKLAEMQTQFAQQAYSSFLPVVDSIIKTKETDIQHIERTLDQILDFCFDNQMLLLYRRLCRYLYNIDKEATAFYIQAYREMWDENAEHF